MKGGRMTSGQELSDPYGSRVAAGRAPVRGDDPHGSRTNELDVEGERRIYHALRHFWHPVIYSHNLNDGPESVELCGEHLVAVRLDGEVAVFNDLCAHRGTALSLGTVVANGGEIRCAYHGWQYDGSGACTRIPQRPDLVKHIRARLKKYPAVERYGMVWVCLVDEAHYPLPEFPVWEDERFDRVFLPVSDWKCSAPRRTENYMDLGHFAIVHDGLLGDVDHPEVGDHSVWREGPVLRMQLNEAYREPITDKNASQGVGGDVESSKAWHLFMPLTVYLDSEVNGSRFCLFFHPTPIGPKSTRNFTIGARNFGSIDTIHRDIVEFNEVVYGQDKPIVESQRPEELPEDLSEELHLKGVDTLSVHYRRWLLEIAREVEDEKILDSERSR